MSAPYLPRVYRLSARAYIEPIYGGKFLSNHQLIFMHTFLFFLAIYMDAGIGII